MSTIADIILQRSRVENLRKQADLKRRFGLAFYEPHFKQDLFHAAGEFKSRYARTGNRFGKSTMGAAEDCAWALGFRPWYQRAFNVKDAKGKVVRRHDPVKDVELVHRGLPKRCVKGLIVCADWDKAEEIFTCQNNGADRGKLFKLLPEDKVVDVIKNQSGKICTVLVESMWGGVSSINLDTVKSYKSNKMGQESSDWDFIHVDEPCPQGMYKANARGLVDREGSEWFTCTPLEEMWINDHFLPEGNIRDEFDEPNVSEVTVEFDEEKLVVRRWMIDGSMHDNPHLTSAGKANFISTLTDEEKETRVDGRPAQLTGNIYKQFHRHEHIYQDVPRGWTDYCEPPENYTIRMAIDTHPSNPHATLFAATAPTGHVFFFAELYKKDFIKNYCYSLKQILNGRFPHRCLIELAAYNDNPVGEGLTIADEFIQNGFPIEPATKDLSYGILRVQQELARRDSNGIPFLLFSPQLAETIREFDRYVWDGDKGKPRDENDHMMECLYRLVLTGLEYVEPDNVKKAPVKPMDVTQVAQQKLPALPALREFKTLTKHKSLPKLNGDIHPETRRRMLEKQRQRSLIA